MFEITLITMGKLKEKFYISAAQEYAKRLGAYCRFSLLELPEVRLPEDPSPAEISAGLEKEAELPYYFYLVSVLLKPSLPHTTTASLSASSLQFILYLLLSIYDYLLKTLQILLFLICLIINLSSNYKLVTILNGTY